MSLIFNEALIGAAGQGGAYEIEQSLRFDGSSKLSRTPSSAGTTTTWTLSYWIKIGSLTAEQAILSATPPGGGYTATWYSAGATSRLKINQYNHPTNVYSKCPTPVYRDPSAWFHVVVVFDSTNATADDRVRFYVNGVRLTDFSDDGSSVGGTTNPSQNQTSGINNNSIHYIGSQYDGTYAFTNSYLAEMHLLDGTAVTDALDFGEYDDNGVWRPIEYTGSYGTNGFYLKFDPSATNGIGHDHSGNGNNWSPSGFTTSGTGTDVMSDTPTTNWCTLNPLYSPATSSNTPRNGNLEVVSSTTGYDQVHIATHAFTSGKWYWEYRLEGSIVAGGAGIIDPTTTAFHDMMRSTTPSLNLTGGFQRRQGGTVSSAGVSNVSSGSISNGTVAMFAVDYDSGKVWVGTAGSWYNSGDPAAGTNPTITIQTLTTAVPFFSPTDSGSQTYYANWGQRAFEYTQPSGFNALNTSKLPAPTVKDGSDYFDTLTWSGTGGGSGATRSLTGLEFSPDFVWGKIRTSSSPGHILMDAVRGVGTGKYLQSNTTNAEGTSGPNESLYGYLSSLDSNGFTVTNGTSTFDNWNKSGDTYVAWNWLAGNGTSSNTDGTVTSTVSANQAAGFSIVGYTGNGSTGTVGHGLNDVPKMIIAKNRNNSGHWFIYHDSLASGKALRFDVIAAYTPSPAGINAVSSSTFTLGGARDETNTLNGTYVAYCFAEVEGYSKFGSYTGNGSSDGVFIYTGFKPAYFLWKISSSTGGWGVLDVKRDTYNVSGKQLGPDDSDLEASYTVLDFVSNGIKMRNSFGDTNASGATFIYAAFSENPFGGSGVTPATAR